MQFIRKHSTQLIIFSSLLTLTSGTLGYWLNRGNDTAARSVLLDGFNALLSAIGHLGLGGFEKPGPDNGQLTVSQLCLLTSRVAGLAFVFLGAERLLSAISANYAQLLFSWKMLGSQPLYVVIGMGWYGRAFMNHLDQSEQTDAKHGAFVAKTKATAKNTVFIDLAPSDMAIQECEQKRASWRQAAGSSHNLLSSIPWHRVEKLFAVAGSDLTNAQIIRMVNEQINKADSSVSRDKNIPLPCVVPVDSSVAFEAMLSNSHLAPSSIELRTFNDYETTTRMLLETQITARNFKKGVASRLVLIGQGRMASALLEQWMLNQIFESEIDTCIDVVHPDPDSAFFDFCDKYLCYSRSTDQNLSLTAALHVATPDNVWLEEKVLPIVRFHRLPSGISGPLRWADANLSDKDRFARCTTIAIVFDDLTSSIQNATILRRVFQNQYPLRTNGAGLLWWVYLNTQEAALFESLREHLNLQNPGEGPNVGFQDFLGKCSIETVSNDQIERAGMAVHKVYNPFSTLEAKELWISCDMTDKESSRLCGLHAWVKESIVDRLNSDGVVPNDKHKKVPGTIIRELSKVEHRRWCAVHLLHGYRPLLTLKGDAVLESEHHIVRTWYEPDGKNLYRSQYKHLCLMPYNSLANLNRVVDGKGSAEQRKDRRISIATRQIIAYAERSSSN